MNCFGAQGAAADGRGGVLTNWNTITLTPTSAWAPQSGGAGVYKLCVSTNNEDFTYVPGALLFVALPLEQKPEPSFFPLVEDE